jgi:hypothetical protein
MQGAAYWRGKLLRGLVQHMLMRVVPVLYAGYVETAG